MHGTGNRQQLVDDMEGKRGERKDEKHLEARHLLSRSVTLGCSLSESLRIQYYKLDNIVKISTLLHTRKLFNLVIINISR